MKPDKQKKIALWLAFTSGIYCGLFIGLWYTNEKVVDVIRSIWGVTLLVALLLWTYADAEANEYRIGKLKMLCFVFLPWVAFPWYVFGAHGKRGFIPLILAILILVVTIGIGGIVALIVGGDPHIKELIGN